MIALGIHFIASIANCGGLLNGHRVYNKFGVIIVEKITNKYMGVIIGTPTVIFK